jgi:hypothetical protein
VSTSNLDLEGYVGMLYVALFTNGISVSDAIGTCGSSLILILRTRAVWQSDMKVSVGLGILFLGQISLWLQSYYLPHIMDIMSAYLVFSLAFRYSKAQWDPRRNVCAVVSTAPRPILVAVFSYS